MSEPFGRIVLRRVADHYRAHPTSWCTNYGTLLDTFDLKPEQIQERLNDPSRTGCIDTVIRCQSIVLFGAQAAQAAADDAIRMLCEHHRLEYQSSSIHHFNDRVCVSVENAIDFVEAALDIVPVSKSKMPAVVTMIAVVLAVSAFLGFISCTTV